MIYYRENNRTSALWILLASAAFLRVPHVYGQLKSSNTAITLNAVLAESISVSATPTTVTLTLVSGGVARGSTPVAVTTSWVLASSRESVLLDVYLADLPAALLGSTSPVIYISSSEDFSFVSTGKPDPFAAFSSNKIFGSTGAVLPLFRQAIGAANRNSKRTDRLSLEISWKAQPWVPTASSYNGTLCLQAQAL